MTSTDAFGLVTEYFYDRRGNLTEVSGPDGNLTRSEYDTTNRLRASVDAADNRTEYAYDTRGNLTSLVTVEENGQRITASRFAYDGKGRLLSSTGIDPDGFGPQEPVTRKFEYNEFGDQVASWFTDADGALQLTRTAYDFEGRVKGTSLILGASEQLDQIGKRTVASGGNTVWSTETTFDGAGRVASSTDRFGHTTETFYDARGNTVETRTQAEDRGTPVLLVTRTAYDDNGRAVASTDPFLLNADGTSRIPATDLRVTHTLHDAAGRVVETRRLAGVDINVGASAACRRYPPIPTHASARAFSTPPTPLRPSSPATLPATAMMVRSTKPRRSKVS